MSDLNAAKKRLDTALVRLDKVVDAGAAAAGPNPAGRIADLESEAVDLKAQIASLQEQNKELDVQISQARTSYAALEEVADAVSSRLDTAIGGIRTVMEH